MFGREVRFLDSASIKKGLAVGGVASLSGGIVTNNADINAGEGKLTASNVVYSILPGSNITITGDRQNPRISAIAPVAVQSLQGQTGVLNLTNGTGISLNGLQINNTGVLSLQGETGGVTLTGGNGISVSGTTITNTDTGTAQDIFKTFTIGTTDITASTNNDTFNFAAGSGISLTGDAGSKTLTITNTGSSGGLSGLSTNGVLYATSSTTATSTSPGTTGTVLHGITNGAPVFSTVNLGTDVSGILPTGNGGTGISTIPTNGEVLIGNGTGYQLGTISAGSGIGVSNGSGTITVTNNGVVSLNGTANQVLVNGVISTQTGAVTLSLPQDIGTASTPSFSSLNLTSNTNELTLGSGNTGVITIGALTTGRTYTFPDASGTVCLTSGNCSGSGGR